MKISELSTERATDVLCEITPYIINITADPELLQELKAAVDFSGAATMAEKLALTANKMSKLIPILLKKKRTEIYGILGALNDVSPEDIAKQKLLKTMGQIRDISKDKELLDFFKSCTSTEGSE